MKKSEFIELIAILYPGEKKKWMREQLLKREGEFPEEIEQPEKLIYQLARTSSPMAPAGPVSEYSCGYTIGDCPGDANLGSPEKKVAK